MRNRGPKDRERYRERKETWREMIRYDSNLKCGPSNKIRFTTFDAALARSREIESQDGIFLRVYRCWFCGDFHLTSKDNKKTLNKDLTATQTHVKLNT